MMGHKICLYVEIWLIIPRLSLLPLLTWSIDYHLLESLDHGSSNENPQNILWRAKKKKKEKKLDECQITIQSEYDEY